MSSFFLSHSSQDLKLAEGMRDRLRQWGYDSLFLDFDPDDGIAVGRDWEQELYHQLRVSDAVLFLGTDAAVTSKWCFAELTLARSAKKPIFPLDLDGRGRMPLLADRQYLDLTDGDDGYERLRRALRERFDPRDAFKWDLERPPYPGLTAFRAEDAAVFFGRDEVIDEVLGKLDATLGRGRCIAVIGASGSGKSSLVRAGVLPRLARAHERWTLVPPFTPGERPTAALARALAGALQSSGVAGDRHALQERLAADPGELAEVLRDVAGGGDDGQRSVLVVIDQAEELVVLADAVERTRFLALLRHAMRSGLPLWILATLRSEFLSASLRDTSLVELIEESVLVGPVGRPRLAEIILGPAAKAGLEFAPGLVERIVDDTRGGDALPLLAYTLRELYDRRPGRGVISGADYDAIGGVLGALRRRADRVAEELEAAGHGAQMLPTLLRLVTVDAEGQPARRRVPRSAFRERESEVVRAFVDARLLVSARRGDEAVVEVAHEALMRVWPPFTTAIEASRDALRLQTELERDAGEWIRDGRPDSYLLRGERLARARRLLLSPLPSGTGELGPAEREFFDASEALERNERAAANRRRRRTIGGLSLALLIISAAALTSFWQFRQAEDQRDQAELQRNRAVSQQLAATALGRLAGDNELGTLLALEANRTARTDQAEDALRVALSRSPVLARLDTTGPVRRLSFSPDGELVIAVLAESVEGYDTGSGARRFSLATRADSVVLEPGGRRVLTRGRRGAQLWRTDSGGLVGTLAGPTLAAGFVDGRAVALQKDAREDLRLRAVPSGAVVQTLGHGFPLGAEGGTFSPTGRHLLTWSFEHARIWDVARRRWTGPPIRLPGYADAGAVPGTSVAPMFSGDGRLFAMPLIAGGVHVFSTARRRALGIIRPTAALVSLAFSAHGDLAVGGVPVVKVWSARKRRVVARLLHDGSVTSTTLSDDGRRVLTVEANGPVRVWDVPRERVLTVVPQRRGVARAFALSPDGRVAATAGERGGLLVNAGPDAPSTAVGSTGRRVYGAWFTYGGGEIIAATNDGVAEVWSVPALKRLARHRVTRPPAGLLGSSDDDRLIYAVDRQGVVSVWDWRAGRRRARFPTTGRVPYIADLSPDNGRLVTSDKRGEIRLWNVSTGRRLRALPGPKDLVIVTDFTRDGRFLVTGVAAHPIRVRRASGALAPVAAVRGADGLFGAVLSQDGRRLTTYALNLQIEVWDVATGRRVSDDTLRIPTVGGRPGLKLYSDARGHVVAGVTHARAWIWNLDDPARERVEVPGGISASLSPTGRYLVTVERDGATVWDTRSGQRVETFPARFDGQPGVAISPDERWVLASGRRQIRLFRCRLCVGREELIRLASGAMTRDLTAQERRKFLDDPPVVPAARAADGS